MRQKAPPAPVPLLALTPTQVCEAVQIGRDTFDQWSHRRGFPVIRDGKTILVPLESLRQWLTEQAAETNAEPNSLAEQLAQLPVAAGGTGRRDFRIGSRVQPRPGDFTA